MQKFKQNRFAYSTNKMYVAWNMYILPVRLFLNDYEKISRKNVILSVIFWRSTNATTWSRFCGLSVLSQNVWKWECRRRSCYRLSRNVLYVQLMLFIWYFVLVFSFSGRRSSNRRRPIKLFDWRLRHCELYIRKIQSSSRPFLENQWHQGMYCRFARSFISVIQPDIIKSALFLDRIVRTCMLSV